MNRTSNAKIVSNSVYGIGVAIFVTLVLLFIFGADCVPYPDNMLPYTLRDIAFLFAAFGAIPMIVACFAVYTLNDVKSSARKKRNAVMIFAPGVICGVCFLIVVGFLAVMLVRAMVHINT